MAVIYRRTLLATITLLCIGQVTGSNLNPKTVHFSVLVIFLGKYRHLKLGHELFLHTILTHYVLINLSFDDVQSGTDVVKYPTSKLNKYNALSVTDTP